MVENIFYGNLKNALFFCLLVALTLLMTEIIFYKRNIEINVLYLTFSTFFFAFLAYFIIKLNHVFVEKKFIEILSDQFDRNRAVLIFISTFFMLYTIWFLSEEPLVILGYNLIFVQKSLGLILFFSSILLIYLSVNSLSLKFNDNFPSYEESKIEISKLKNDETNNVLLLSDYLTSKIIYKNASFSRKFDYIKISEKLFENEFMKTQDGKLESTTRNFIKFINGEKLDQLLIWIDKNPRGVKKTTYINLALLLSELSMNLSTSRKKFLQERLSACFEWKEIELNINSFETSFLSKKTYNTKRRQKIYEIIEYAKTTN